jgi:hypothetical protein
MVNRRAVISFPNCSILQRRVFCESTLSPLLLEIELRLLSFVTARRTDGAMHEQDKRSSFPLFHSTALQYNSHPHPILRY